MAKPHFLLDGDGVLWRGTEVLSGAPEFLKFLREQGYAYSLVTNNSTRRRADVSRDVTDKGLPFAAEDVFNTNYLAGCYMHDHYRHAEILAIGGEGLVAEIRARGLKVHSAEELLPPDSGEPMSIKPYLRQALTVEPEAIVIGLDIGVTYRRMALACRLIEDGAKFIATNRDYTFPLEEGYLLPGNGAIIDIVERVTGVEATGLGKPETHLVELAERERGIPRSEMVMIGDRLETDIRMAGRAGIRSVLVLTGVTEEVPEHWPSGAEPTFVMRDLFELRDRFGECFG